ncbi:isoprenoid synthase domain-containing protein [Aspergillus venezuelensis]
MNHQYSIQVDPRAYQPKTQGLDGGIPLRVHADPCNREVAGTLRVHNDWSRCVRPVPGYKGGLGEMVNFIGACVPECFPERLEIISYANEFAFLYDDAMEEVLDARPESQNQNQNHNQSRRRDPRTTTPGDTLDGWDALLQAKQLRLQIVQEMAAIDSERAMTTNEAWTKFLTLAAGSRSRPLFTLADIRDDELELCMQLARPGYAAISLTNDLYSWDKEREQAQRAGIGYVYNAIWVIMQEKSVSEEEAKTMCMREILYNIRRFCELVEMANRSDWLSWDLKMYLEAVKASHVGNLVWSIHCPRYRSVE